MRTPSRFLAAFPALAVLALASIAVAGDTDGDGIDDSIDPLPCDNTVASATYVPSGNSHGTVLLEDNWPTWGDLDFNDAVVSYQYELGYNAAGNIKRIVATYNVLASGNGRANGFAVQFPIPKANVGSATLQVGAGAANALPTVAGPQSGSIRSADANLTVDLLTDTHAAFGINDSNVNTSAAKSVQASQVYKLTIVLATPVAMPAAAAPYDMFFYWTSAPGHEIHRPQYAGTSAFTAALKCTQQDRSSGCPGGNARNFVDTTGLPYVLDVPQGLAWDKETVAISSAYAQILGFASSNGTSNTTWYSSPTAANTFTSGLGGALPPAPVFIGGSGTFVAE